VGVFTRQDLGFCNTLNARMADVMTREPITAIPTINEEGAFMIMQQRKIKLLPLVHEEDGRVAGLYTWKDVKRVVTNTSSSDNVGPDKRLRVAAAIGVVATGTDTADRIDALVENSVDVLVIDMAHGDSRAVVETVRWIKSRYHENVDVVAGNVSRAKSASRLFEAGAEGVRVGQGPGSTCTTGLITGTGIPLATALDDCARAGQQYGLPIGADGGIQYSGDVVKALALGASYAVLGRMFAGTDEAPGEVVSWEGGLWKEYRGMGSLGAMVARAGSRERYQQSSVPVDHLVPEGIEGRVPYAGALKEVVVQLIGGIQKGMFNAGARTIDKLWEKAIIYRLQSTGRAQAHPKIVITKQAPNYNIENKNL
ncbi:MAG: IMP dehydrogenase, partial [Patescibacteria group bacterium]